MNFSKFRFFSISIERIEGFDIAKKSGCWELDPGYRTPSAVYCRYTTSRKTDILHYNKKLLQLAYYGQDSYIQ